MYTNCCQAGLKKYKRNDIPPRDGGSGNGSFVLDNHIDTAGVVYLDAIGDCKTK